MRLLFTLIALLHIAPICAQVSTTDATVEELSRKKMWDRFDLERWTPVRVSDDALVGYDARKIEILGNRKYRTWFRWDYSQPRTVHGFTYVYNIEKDEVDCRELKYRTLAEHSYDDNGEQVHSYTAKNAATERWDEIVPETVGETVYAAFCKTMADDYENKGKKRKKR